ncbi:MAG: hypothetical protein HY869_01135 [Chloroflexi bacterium]|nr:hypothetical protein [Chloroflexota bacterium]
MSKSSDRTVISEALDGFKQLVAQSDELHSNLLNEEFKDIQEYHEPMKEVITSLRQQYETIESLSGVEISDLLHCQSILMFQLLSKMVDLQARTEKVGKTVEDAARYTTNRVIQGVSGSIYPPLPCLYQKEDSFNQSLRAGSQNSEIKGMLQDILRLLGGSSYQSDSR